MKALVAGLGSIGTRHARNLRALGVETVMGYDPDAARRQVFDAEFGGKSFADLSVALAEPSDLAVIASPNRFHVEQALAAARAGRHLLIEKPLSHNMDGVRELIDEVGKRGLFCHVGSNWKFHPAFQRMKALLADGAVGRLTGAQIIAGLWLPDWHPLEDYRRMYAARRDLGGGVIRDTHELDYLTWLMGPARCLTGLARRSGVLDIETEDVAVAAIELESGVLVSLLTDYIQRDYRRRYLMSGDGGTVEWDFQSARVDHFDAARKTTKSFDCAVADINEMYVEQSRHVLAGIAGGLPPVTPLSHALHVLELQIQWRAASGLT
jgi:predicted dehydrogenase